MSGLRRRLGVRTRIKRGIDKNWPRLVCKPNHDTIALMSITLLYAAPSVLPLALSRRCRLETPFGIRSPWRSANRRRLRPSMCSNNNLTCAAKVWAGIDIVASVVQLIYGCVTAFVYGLGGIIFPYNVAGILLLIAGLLTTVTSSFVCSASPARVLLAGAIVGSVIALAAACFLAAEPKYCAEAQCHGIYTCEPYEETLWASFADDDAGLDNGGTVCYYKDFFEALSCGKRYGTWYDPDFKNRKESDEAWWGFKKESDCLKYVEDEFPFERIGMLLILVGYVPAAISHISLIISVLLGRKEANVGDNAVPVAEANVPPSNIEIGK